MKKFLSVILSVMLIMSVCALVACNNNTENPDNTENVSISIVAPDGAPALSLAKLMNDDNQFGAKVTYKVVNASDITKHIAGAGEKADVALVPVNAASKILASGNEYKGVATVTHGNLYMLTKDGTEINKDNLSSLKGKTVAVVNIANVPGLTFKALLKKNNIEFTEDESEKSEEKVYLAGIAGTDIAPSLVKGTADYVVAPEPAVSTVTSAKPIIKKAAALHDIYGAYPQAVMVVKASVLEKNKNLIKKIYDAMVENQQWIVENPALAAKAVEGKLLEGLTASFNEKNTTADSVAGCNIKMVSFTESEINVVKTYIADVKSVGESAVGEFTDNFFFDITK